MNYYELIYLKNEFKNKLTNGIIEQAITPYKNLLELYIDTEEESFRLIFSSSPGNLALFLDTYRPGKKSNKLLFFEEVYGVKISDVSLTDNDRLLSLKFENGQKLTFKLFSNKANVLHISNEKVVGAFKDHGEVGSPEPKPKIQTILKDIPDNDSPKNMILQANPILPRNELEELIILNELNLKTPKEIFAFIEELTNELSTNPDFRKLEDGSTTIIGENLLPLKTEGRFKSINELIAYRFKNYSHFQRLTQQKGSFRKTIKRQVKRLESALKNLSEADKGIEKANKFEKFGHLLMANAHLNVQNADSIIVNDLYDEGNEIKIKLNPELKIAENAEYYYDRASSSLTSYKEANKRIPIIEERSSRLKRMEMELAEIKYLRDLEEWKKKFQKEIENLGIGKIKKEENSLPFHTLRIKDYQIWIGKNAKSNDILVQLSHKEDIWMHARGVPGSHLVIRMANEKGMPSKEVLEEAASYAAYNSKAKGANLVPVIVAKRKYVRKPKGAAPGAVLVQKEEVELVSPKKPIL